MSAVSFGDFALKETDTHGNVFSEQNEPVKTALRMSICEVQGRHPKALTHFSVEGCDLLLAFAHATASSSAGWQ